MARTYRRDASGRFSGGGGGGGKKGGGSKAASTKAADKARAAELRAKGTTGIGGRVKAKGFKGKKAQYTAGGLTSGRAPQGSSNPDRAISGRPSTPRGTISGNAKVRAGNAMKRQKSAARAASKANMKPKTGQQAKFAKKAQSSSAKGEFKKLRSSQRADRRYAGIPGQSPAKAAATTRKLNTMVAKRGVSGGKKRRKK